MRSGYYIPTVRIHNQKIECTIFQVESLFCFCFNLCVLLGSRPDHWSASADSCLVLVFPQLWPFSLTPHLACLKETTTLESPWSRLITLSTHTSCLPFLLRPLSARIFAAIVESAWSLNWGHWGIGHATQVAKVKSNENERLGLLDFWYMHILIWFFATVREMGYQNIK